jgi:general secretion pathway protein J
MMQGMAVPRQRDAGFTLLEVLVALVVFGLLMAGLAQSVRFGLSAWGTQAIIVDRHNDLDAVDRTLRTLIDQMDPGSSYTNGAQVEGDSRQFSFITELPVASGDMATRQADVSLMVDAAHRFLLLWSPHRRSVVAGRVVPNRTVLLENVDHVEFSYRPANSLSWLRAWNGRSLPDLVRIRILFRAGDERHWPDIVAAPMLDVNSS